MTETILEIKNLKKSYGKNEVLKDISLSVKKGEVISIIGSSGSGKSTFLRSINLLESPSGGEILYHGDNVLEKGYDLTTYRERLGMVFQSFNLFENLNVLENAIVAQTTVLKRDRKEAESIAKANLEKVGMGEQYWKAKPKQLSGGQKRLLAFVLCLIGKPDILFLDEPTAGMDTTTRQRFWEIINDLKKSGVTVLYSSHYIEEVEHTADRILVLHQGKLIRDTTPHAMRSEEKEKQVTLASRFVPSIDKLAAIYEVTEKRDVVTFMTKDIESVWSSLQALGCRISDIEIQNKTLLDSLFDSTREDKS